MGKVRPSRLIAATTSVLDALEQRYCKWDIAYAMNETYRCALAVGIARLSSSKSLERRAVAELVEAWRRGFLATLLGGRQSCHS